MQLSDGTFSVEAQVMTDEEKGRKFVSGTIVKVALDTSASSKCDVSNGGSTKG